ncbi:acetyltransferase [Brucella endophytica]|uniref:Acetyltransferase n=1 Tax=Brucella endophytica TaxID=1963359 RepID=A0A916SLU3_9HYPH|nr:GNAT family N-acetyltransferase [Brucella endophytica]GGB07315.1 acetyltransferase [Brucella endophytica]
MNMHAIEAMEGVDRLEIVESPDRLAAVEEPWTRLWRECDGLIFQSHGWVSAWWKTLGRPEQTGLRIGLAWKGDRLIAVIPLAITRRKGLRFLEWAAAAHSDYCDILCAPECPDAVLDALWARLCKAGGFDLAFINRLLPDAAARRVFSPGKRTGVRLHLNHRQEISYRIAGDWQSGAAWFKTRSTNARQNHRRKLKMLENGGALRIRLLGPDEPLEPVLDRLVALKRHWLEKSGRSSELFEGGGPALKALVDVLARAGILHLFVIERDGIVVAVSVNFVQHNTMMVWMPTYDAEFARASPGLLLLFEYVQWSIDHGLGMVDLLCGEEAYKGRVATHTVTLETLVGARTAKGSLALLMDGLRQKLRRKETDVSAEDGQ